MVTKTTEVDREFVMLTFALTECRRALDNLAEADELASARYERQPGVVALENQRVFDRIRLALQMAANVSRLFWPPRNSRRGLHLRSLTGLPVDHGLSDRTLRNHIEHLDERLDVWTATSPRPYLKIELVLHKDFLPPGPTRDAAIAATAIVYDAESQTVHLFGDTFSLPSLRIHLQDALEKIAQALVTMTAEWTS